MFFVIYMYFFGKNALCPLDNSFRLLGAKNLDKTLVEGEI